MTMNTQQIQSFVLQYLEAEQCEILEKHPAYVTVKLSPSADRDLTHRPYYWSFVERTGVTPETMSCTFIFDPAAYRELHPQQGQGPKAGISTAAPPGMAGIASSPVQNGTASESVSSTTGQPNIPVQGHQQPQGDSILGRYFGFVPTAYTTRIPRDEVTYGSRRLEQIFDAVRNKGRFIRLFEAYVPSEPKQAQTIPYDTWLAVNYKIEMTCDMKRSEIVSLGIELQNGEIREAFQEWIAARKLTPRLPAHVYVTPDKITLPRAVLFLEQYMEQKLAAYDHRWAEEAHVRLAEEYARVRDYYEPMLKSAEPDARPELETQYERRVQEVEWQYRPRIQISAINCGLFHVPSANRRFS